MQSKLSLIIFLLFLNIISIQSNDCNSANSCMKLKAIENAKINKVRDRSSSLFGCKLSDWSANLNKEKSSEKDKIEVYDVFAYERLLVCYKQKKDLKDGEEAFDVPRRKVPPGTRFHAEVICENDACSTTWISFECCYDTNLNKY